LGSCGLKFGGNTPLFIGLLVLNHRWQKSYHFPSSNQTLSHKDSEEIKKGVNSVLKSEPNLDPDWVGPYPLTWVGLGGLAGLSLNSPLYKFKFF
jgi:hypothetical protein